MATKSDKVWADAVRKAVHEYHEEKDETGIVKKTRWLNKLALQLVTSASKGDITAIKEIGDRLDGKPAQAMQHAGKDGGDLIVNIVKYADDNPSE